MLARAKPMTLFRGSFSFLLARGSPSVLFGFWVFNSRKYSANPQADKYPYGGIRNILHTDILILQYEVKL
jgi:hypothetical protein